MDNKGAMMLHITLKAYLMRNRINIGICFIDVYIDANLANKHLYNNPDVWTQWDCIAITMDDIIQALKAMAFYD